MLSSRQQGLLLVLCLGLFGLFPLWSFLQNRRCDAAYNLLNPLRRCGEQQLKREYDAFQEALRERLDAVEEQEHVDVALYFRDLQGGPWFGVNEESEFFAASLTKVPTMIVLLKIAEEHPEILSKQIGLDEAPPIARSIDASETQKTITIGEEYTVAEVLRRSIVYSDNYADFLLRVFLTEITERPDFLVQAFRELGVVGPNETELQLSVKGYSSIFRLLYNGQFLNREMSQKALDLLLQSEYNGGLRKHLPPTIRVAHKFGYYNEGEQHTEPLQLHDCGIVYHPSAPYLICIMTRGNDLDVMSSIIADLSKIIHDEVDDRAAE